MRKHVVATLLLVLAAGAAWGQGLTVWTILDGPALGTLQEDAAVFSSTFGVEVEVVGLDLNELKRRMLVAAPEGAAADVVIGVPHDQVADLADGGVLADLRGSVTAEYLADLSEPARLAFTYDGRLVGLPLFVEGPALLYDRSSIDEVPATYEALVATARELTTEDRHGFLFDVDNFYFNYAWFGTHGGYVFGREDGALQPDDVGLANEGAIAGANALRDLRYEHGLIPPGTDYATARDRFVNGDLAMFYTGPWAVRPAREAGVDVGVAPMPPLADGTPWSGFMGVQGVLVNGFARQRTDAMNLAKWLTRADAQAAYARLHGRIPASHEALARVADDPVVAGFGEALLTSEPIPNIRAMGRVWAPMAAAIDVIMGSADASVAEALDRAVRRIRGE